ncbi:MAG: DUF4982 domain-containing protein [Reichenbachiella sp.]
MLNTKNFKFRWLNGLIAIILFASCQFSDKTANTDFNFDWKFSRGDFPEAKNVVFDESAWKDVRLPHDWSVEESYTQEEAAGATAFLPGGIGWYRKTFKMPASASDKITRVNFDGIYTKSEVWINGNYLGKRPYGYIGFYYDLTPYLKYGDEENVLAVRADRSAYIDCRWYPGSGIYRKVRLETLDRAHLTEWGTYITTPKVDSNSALVDVTNTVINESDEDKSLVIRTILIDDKGKAVIEHDKPFSIAKLTTIEVKQELMIDEPNLWDIETPNLYVANISILENGKLLDEYNTTFGIREIVYDADKGFFLNGKKRVFKGVCLHHDGGLVGAAVPDGVWERRLRLLKEAGCNAIRTAHNPPSEAFLDLCDRMGFLVQDESFDEWDNPKDKRNNYNQQKAELVTKGYTEDIKEWAERDVKSMVLRDRNHPSIVMWSIGNEIEWTYPAYRATGYWDQISKDKGINYYYDEPPYSPKEIKERFAQRDTAKYNLATMANNLSKWVKEIDTTRPVTANLVIPSVSYFSGYTDALDIVGLSYRQSVYDYVKREYPGKLVLGTENWAQWHEWKPVLEKDHIHGIFLWTGIFYMGESRNWPKKGSSSGLLDFAGYKRASFHMFKTLWNDEPHVYMSTVPVSESPYEIVEGEVLSKRRNDKYIPKWGWQNYNDHWNYNPQDSTAIEVYTNCNEVELMLNGSSLGSKKLADNMGDHIIKWFVPFESGELIAKGTHDDGAVVEYKLKSAGEMGGLSINADTQTLTADGYDVAHIEVELIDSEGIPFRTNDQEVEFVVKGDCKILGVDNGANDNVQDIQSNKIVTANGRCMMIIQSNLTKGKVTLLAKSNGFESKEISFLIQ